MIFVSKNSFYVRLRSIYIRKQVNLHYTSLFIINNFLRTPPYGHICILLSVFFSKNLRLKNYEYAIFLKCPQCPDGGRSPFLLILPSGYPPPFLKIFHPHFLADFFPKFKFRVLARLFILCVF